MNGRELYEPLIVANLDRIISAHGERRIEGATNVVCQICKTLSRSRTEQDWKWLHEQTRELADQ